MCSDRFLCFGYHYRHDIIPNNYVSDDRNNSLSGLLCRVLSVCLQIRLHLRFADGPNWSRAETVQDTVALNRKVPTVELCHRQ